MTTSVDRKTTKPLHTSSPSDSNTNNLPLLIVSTSSGTANQTRSGQVRDLDFGIKVIGSEIVREPDGLAMSSRNVKLSTENRQRALSISRVLFRTQVQAEKGQVNCSELIETAILFIEEAGGRVDYAEIVEQESLEVVETIKSPVVFCLAAWFGGVRLIDNIEISV